MLTAEANATPAFVNDASLVEQICTKGKAAADLTMSEATGGNRTLTYTLTKSDVVALPSRLSFNTKTRVLAGMPASRAEAAVIDYTLTIRDTDSDTDDLILHITTRAANATPLSLTPSGTLSVAGTSTTSNTSRLTSSGGLEGSRSGGLDHGGSTATETAQAITLTYEANGAIQERTGRVTLKRRSQGHHRPLRSP